MFVLRFVDKVFRSSSSTREVYEQGAKDVAISVVNGFNCEYGFLYSNFILLVTLLMEFCAKLLSQQVFLRTDKQVVERLIP